MATKSSRTTEQQPAVILSLDEKMRSHAVDRSFFLSSGIRIVRWDEWDQVIRGVTTKKAQLLHINLDATNDAAIPIVHQIRSNNKIHELPILVTSVKPNHASKAAALKAGANLFVELPLPQDVYLEKIKSFLDISTRSTARVEGIGSVNLRVKGKEYQVDVEDISITGLFIRFEEHFETHTGCKVCLSFLPKSADKWIESEVARVIRPDHRNPSRELGLGIKFIDLKPQIENELRTFIHEQLDDRVDHLQFYF
ncbi:MAG: PilZ domain-containing protein [Zetaproteobacteria bacterium]|nr:PilZ domain-containing protein [Zetaproteobacteria bacterium]